MSRPWPKSRPDLINVVRAAYASSANINSMKTSSARHSHSHTHATLYIVQRASNGDKLHHYLATAAVHTVTGIQLQSFFWCVKGSVEEKSCEGIDGKQKIHSLCWTRGGLCLFSLTGSLGKMGQTRVAKRESGGRKFWILWCDEAIWTLKRGHIG